VKGHFSELRERRAGHNMREIQLEMLQIILIVQYRLDLQFVTLCSIQRTRIVAHSGIFCINGILSLSDRHAMKYLVYWGRVF
jgi:hypothetical protein